MDDEDIEEERREMANLHDSQAEEEDDDFVSEAQLITALQQAESDLKKHQLPPSIARLLELVVARLIETEQKFNQHGHTTRTNLHSDEYESAGSGFAGPPAEQGSYGCHESIKIGS